MSCDAHLLTARQRGKYRPSVALCYAVSLLHYEAVWPEERGKHRLATTLRTEGSLEKESEVGGGKNPSKPLNEAQY